MRTTLDDVPSTLEDIPWVGPSIAGCLRMIGVEEPSDLVGADPYALYDELEDAAGVRYDPCVLDTFICAVRFVEGGPRIPWWAFTEERKRTLAERR